MATPTPTTPAPWTPLLQEVFLGETLKVRELPPDEWHRMCEAGGFFADGTKIPAPMENCRVVVAECLEDTGWQVVAYCPVFDAVHLEPLHFREDFRRHPHLGQVFLGGLVTLLQTAGIRYVWATIANGQPGAESIIQKLGFTPLDGRTWTGRIPPKDVTYHSMTARVLDPGEWLRLPQDTELAALVPMLRPGIDEVHVVENAAGEIVGCWSLIQSVHAEGIWTREDHRGQLPVLAALWRQMKARVRARGWHRLFTSARSEEVRALITSARVGGEPFPESFVIGVD